MKDSGYNNNGLVHLDRETHTTGDWISITGTPGGIGLDSMTNIATGQSFMPSNFQQ